MSEQMRGANKIILCALEMHVAIQEYLDKRLTVYAPEVWSVSHEHNAFVISVQPKKVPHAESA